VTKTFRIILYFRSATVKSSMLPSVGLERKSLQADGQVSCEVNEVLVSVFCPSGGAPDGAKCPSAPTIGLCLTKQ
jgi:hypothetical protein